MVAFVIGLGVTAVLACIAVLALDAIADKRFYNELDERVRNLEQKGEQDGQC